jgi:phosphatidylethanolamine/phosphatidyl-N-methylethanolamine N-methyltransferase
MQTLSTESIKKTYRRYSRYYDFVFGPVFHPGRRKAVECLNCKPGDRILEVGVGTGLSLGMYPPGVSVTGIDLSEDMLIHARAKVTEEKMNHVKGLFQMDAQEMSFSDNAFEKVVAMYVASVVPDPAKFAAEIRRVCQPGGRIIFLNHFENKNPVVKKMEALAQPLANYLGFHPDFPLDEFLKETGFQVTDTYPVNFLNYWTVLVGVNDKPALLQ